MYRYIGNKTKLLPEIMEETAALIGDSGTVADVMAGTGSVASEYRRRGYKVIASDVMTYSRHHLTTQLLLDCPPRFEQISIGASDALTRYEAVLNHLNGLDPVEGYFFKEFSPNGEPANGTPPRKYFTSDNARRIDAVRIAIGEWANSGYLTDKEESLLRHDLIMAANEVANISGTYGYFLSSFNSSSRTPFELKPSTFEAGRVDNIVMQGYAEALASSIAADLCYIDPPYIKRQYAANYHILETLARGDEPIAQGKSGLRPWRDQYSNLCTKTKSKQSFETIIEQMDCPYFLISYSEDGLFPVEELLELFARFGEVTLKEIDYKRFRSNSSSLAKNISEYLIVVKKRSGDVHAVR